jgi:hypothetical protein
MLIYAVGSKSKNALPKVDIKTDLLCPKGTSTNKYLFLIPAQGKALMR